MKQSLPQQDIGMKNGPKTPENGLLPCRKEMWQRARFRARRSREGAIDNAT